MSIKNTTICAFIGLFSLIFISTGSTQSNETDNPVNTDPTETYRADYSDIGYPNIGFSPYVKGWVNGYLTPDDYPDGGAILPLKRKPILHEINGQADMHQEIARLGELIKEKELDVIFAALEIIAI